VLGLAYELGCFIAECGLCIWFFVFDMGCLGVFVRYLDVFYRRIFMEFRGVYFGGFGWFFEGDILGCW